MSPDVQDENARVWREDQIRTHALSEALREAEAAQVHDNFRWIALMNTAGGDKPTQTPGVDLIHGREHDDTITPAEARALARLLLLAADKAEATTVYALVPKGDKS